MFSANVSDLVKCDGIGDGAANGGDVYFVGIDNSVTLNGTIGTLDPVNRNLVLFAQVEHVLLVPLPRPHDSAPVTWLSSRP